MKLKNTIIWILTTVSILTIAVFAYDYYSRYASWKNISPDVILEKTEWYLENRALDKSSITAVCLYIVACEDDRARLVLVKNVESVDFDILRNRIWDRRFNGTCGGRTSNLGLHILRKPEVTKSIYSSSDHAIWSFHNDRFIPRLGRFSSGSFSEEPWERCTAERAFYFMTEWAA